MHLCTVKRSNVRHEFEVYVGSTHLVSVKRNVEISEQIICTYAQSIPRKIAEENAGTQRGGA
jgi:predicted ATP-grasp superfamily ATP-dependent carboligase